MSLLNVLLFPDRALVAADTRCKNYQSGGYFDGSKMFPIVHANVLIAGRGDRIFADLVFQWYGGCETCDFDSIADGLSENLLMIGERYASIPGVHVGGDELVIVGWSEKHRAMQGLLCVRPDGNSEFTVSRMVTGSIGPRLTADLSHVQCADHVESLIEIARAQTRQVRKEQPGLPIGGRLLLAELTRDTLSVRTIADLEAPPPAIQSLAPSGS